VHGVATATNPDGSFARDRMQAGIPAVQSALEAGYTRIRPVLMTALAMIIGMLPMFWGWAKVANRTRRWDALLLVGCCSQPGDVVFVPTSLP